MSIIIKNEIKFASNIIKKIMDSYEKKNSQQENWK